MVFCLCLLVTGSVKSKPETETGSEADVEFYLESPKAGDYSNISGKQISPYDDMIKMAARDLGWDWELLAALIFEESRFDPKADSWVGAKGLMQLMPATAREFGAVDPEDAQQSISAGVKYLKWLDQFWLDRVPDPQERLKFVLASYNVGQAHVLDARKLTAKHGKNSTIWDNNVAYYLLKKSDPEFYNDPVVTAGYCRGHEPVNHVSEILSRAEKYKQPITGQPVFSDL